MIYNFLSRQEPISMDYEEDHEKMNIIRDIQRALKNEKSFNSNFLNSIQARWKYCGEISIDQYNALIKIYQTWRVEERLANIYKHLKVEEDMFFEKED